VKAKFQMARAIVMLLVVSVITYGSIAGQSVSQSSSVRIYGVVKDPNGASISSATLIFEGEGRTQKIHADVEGSYNINLPVGLYQAKVEAPWFCPIRRPAFKVEPGQSIKLDFFLDACPIVNSIKTENGKYKGETDEYVPPFKEERISLKRYAPFEILIYFGQRTELNKNGQISYDMIETINGKLLPVTVMYNLLTIKADKVTFDRNNVRLIFNGHVLIYNNNQIDFGNNAEIEFKNEIPAISVKP
jgi:hypothetical protein